MNICQCGAQAGYKHADNCPFPCYTNELKRMNEWERARTLIDQALNLCDRLSTMFWCEDNHRDMFGRPTADSARLDKLDHLWKRAADRWRRRIGAKPIYRTA